MKYLIGTCLQPDGPGTNATKPKGITSEDWHNHIKLLQVLRQDREENPSSITDWDQGDGQISLYLFTGESIDRVLLIKADSGAEVNTDWEIDPDPNSTVRIIAREFAKWRKEIADRHQESIEILSRIQRKMRG